MITVRTAFTLAAPLALALAATPMIAQAPALPGQPDKARVTAGSYAADPNHSLVAWSVNHLGFNDYYGLFGSVSGTLTLDPANPAAAKVTATIPVSKVSPPAPASPPTCCAPVPMARSPISLVPPRPMPRLPPPA
jgi:polyisoprenoid-binding protein YceI